MENTNNNVNAEKLKALLAAMEKIEKNEKLPEDAVKDNQDKIQKVTDKYTGIIDKAVAEKEKEVMTV